MEHQTLLIWRQRLGTLLLLMLCICAPLHAAPDTLPAALDHILDDSALRGGITGAVVVRVSDGATLYSHDPDLRLLPASNRKLFTAAAALGLLGDDWTYKTQVLTHSKPDAAGVLHGGFILRGAGDAALTTADLDDMAAQMASAGVRRIVGRGTADASLFTDGPYGFGWEWDDFSDEEFGVISALTVNDGDIHVHAAAGPPNNLVVVTLMPPIVGFSALQNDALTAPAGALNTCIVTLPHNANCIHVSGNLPVGSVLDQNVPVPSPADYALLTLCDTAGFGAHGIEFHGNLPPENVSVSPIVLATHVSLPLAQYLPLMMKPSDNLIAECLVRTIGAAKGKAGTYEAGHALETPFFQSLGVDTTAIDLVDGCGVSRRNFVTARTVGQLLVGMAKRPDFKAYYNALPVAGIDGTLKSRMAGTRAVANVHAKTGTLSQVRALSGYVTGPHGGLYAFSLLMNNFPGNARSAGTVQDKFVEYLADALPPAP